MAHAPGPVTQEHTDPPFATERLHFIALTEDHRTRLDVFVCRRVPHLTRSRVQRLIDDGSITCAGARVKPGHLVRQGDAVDVAVPPPVAATPLAESIAIEIVFEDDDLIVVNKPAGLASHPAPGTPTGTLVNALLARTAGLSGIGGVARPGIVHRLDKDTTGLMVVAKNDLAHGELARRLARREIKRTYHALILRNPRDMSGTVDAPIGRHPTVKTRMAVTDNGRQARTHYRVLEPFRGFALVECRLETGRTHQIRVHLAHIKHPVLGDTLYGGSAKVAEQLVPPGIAALRTALHQLATRQMLHARSLEFSHPRTGATVAFSAPYPPDFAELLDSLRLHAG